MTRSWRRTLDGPLVERVESEYPGSPTLMDVRSLARAKTESAINVLAALMFRETTNTLARVTAAKTLLEWGWGKPEQPLVPGDAPFQMVHRIERVIVHPDAPAIPSPSPASKRSRRS